MSVFRGLLAVLVVVSGLTFASVAAQTPDAVSTGQQTQYPVVVENCGVQVTFDHAPERVVTLANNTTEILLALGLEDQFAGMVGNKDRLNERVRDGATDIHVVSETAFPYPSREVVLAASPDLLLSGFGGDFRDEAYGTRDYYQEQGINTLYLKDACETGETVTLDDTYADIRMLEVIFDVQDRAKTLIADMAESAGDFSSDDPLTVFVFQGDTVDATTTVGRGVLVNDLLLRAGGTNVFADQQEAWIPEMSTEELLARDPDVIMIVQFAGLDPQDIIDYWKQDPVFSQLSAVQNDRFAIVPITWTVPSIGNGDVIGLMHSQFSEFDVD